MTNVTNADYRRKQSYLCQTPRAALSNNSFACAVIRLHLHDAMFHRVPGLDGEIESVIQAVRNDSDEDESGDVLEGIKVPKILRDIFESIFCAIVVDQGMQLNEDLKVLLLKLL